MSIFRPISPKALAAAALAFGSLLSGLAFAARLPVPQGGPGIGFAPIGTPFGSSAAYSYLAGRPMIRLPNGIVIDPSNTGGGMNYSGPSQNQASMREQYQVQNAQAVAAYQQGLAQQQRAMAQANSGRKNNSAIRDGFDPRTGKSRNPGTSSRTNRETTPILDADGRINWPDFAPKNASRASMDQAIAAVQAEAKQNGSASLATTVRAKEALRAYGIPAMRGVPGGSKVLAERLREQLARIDGELDRLAEPPSNQE